MVLKMDQMQYFKSQEDFEDIDQTLLFNNANVLKLYARVGQLALETIEAKRKHRLVFFISVVFYSNGFLLLVST